MSVMVEDKRSEGQTRAVTIKNVYTTVEVDALITDILSRVSCCNTLQVINSGFAIDIDGSKYNYWHVTLNQKAVTITLTPRGDLTVITLILEQDAIGNRGVIWPPNIKWEGGIEPVLTAAGGSIDKIILITTDGGTTWIGNTFYNFELPF